MSHRDALNSMSPAKAVQVGYFTASQLADFRPAEQVAGVALFLSVMCEQLRIDPREVINKAARITRDADTYYTREVKALRDYIDGEMKR